MKNWAETLKNLFDKRYYNPNEFERTFSEDSKYVKYEITFIDGSTLIYVMTDQQRNLMHRTSYWQYIKHTGGLGYQKLK